jgi:hypothetical protein
VSETVNGKPAEPLAFDFNYAGAAGLTVLRFVQLVPNSLPAALVRMQAVGGWYSYDLLTVVAGRVTPVSLSDSITSGFLAVAGGHGFSCGVSRTGQLVLTQYTFGERGVSGKLANISETTFVATSDTAMRRVSSVHWVVPLADEGSFSLAC